MIFEGQLDIDFNRGVIWFNDENGCRLRICGLQIPKDYDAATSLIDITFGDSVVVASVDITPAHIAWVD